MSVGPGSPPPPSGPAGDPGSAVLVAAMESAPEAIYCLAASADRPVWANARARALGTDRAELPLLDGRPLADLIDDVLRTGRPETLSGSLGTDGPAATAVVRPLRV